MSEGSERFFMGWIPDYPDVRDFTPAHKEVAPALEKAFRKKGGIRGALRSRLPSSADLRQWCSPVEDQGALGSCTSHAAVGLLEYYERRAHGKHVDASRLFLYKVTRNLLRWKGDTGAFLRSTMGAMVCFGVPPEKYYGYVVAKFDKEPPSFVYGLAESYRTVKYLRLDPPGTSADDLLNGIKTFLRAGFPSMFGFTVYDSVSRAENDGGKIPYPAPGEKVLGGHAVDAVGYDDNLKIRNGDAGPETKGALLIRNSWGAGWGDRGYGWLPYDYVVKGLAEDWWTLTQSGWMDTGMFGF